MSTLLAVGLGYSAAALAARLKAKGWDIIGSTRQTAGADAIAAQGYTPVLFDGVAPSPAPALSEAISRASHILVSAGPDESGDPLLRHCRDDLARSGLRWIGYLSTVGVYGDHGGAWVDEMTLPKPVSARSRARLEAENAWRDFSEETGIDLQIFRLGGIYGPGRGPLEKIREGRAQRVIKPGQVFNRIHVDDIAAVLEAAIALHEAGRLGVLRGRVYNVVDDEPAPPEEVLAFAAKLLGLAPPPAVEFEKANLSPMARSFYGENKRVSNARLKRELGIRLLFPTYREGLRSLLPHLSG